MSDDVALFAGPCPACGNYAKVAGVVEDSDGELVAVEYEHGHTVKLEYLRRDEANPFENVDLDEVMYRE